MFLLHAGVFITLCVLAITDQNYPDPALRPNFGPYRHPFRSPPVPAKNSRSACRLADANYINWMKTQANPIYHHGIGPARFIQSHDAHQDGEGSPVIVFNCADISPWPAIPRIGYRSTGAWIIVCDPATEVAYIDEWNRPPGVPVRYVYLDPPTTEQTIYAIGRCLTHEEYRRKMAFRKPDKTEIAASADLQVSEPVELAQTRVGDVSSWTPMYSEGIVVAALL